MAAQEMTGISMELVTAFFDNHGPFVAGLSAIIFTLIEVVVMLVRIRQPHRHHGGFFEHLRHFGLMLGIVLVTGFGLYALQTKWMRKPQEIIWKEQIDQKLHTCLKNFSSLAETRQHELQQKLEKTHETSDLHCLAHAIQASQAIAPQAKVTSEAARRFQVGMKLGDTILSVGDVPNILQESFSIEGLKYLGYGYSVPVSSKDYSDATVHEFLIRNQCVERSEKKDSPCASKNAPDPQFSTWILSPGAVAQHPSQKIGDLLMQAGSQSDRSRFARHLENDRLKMDPPLLVRFGKFPQSRYVGTVGRPRATYVFFSSLAEVWGKSISEAEAASGRAWDSKDADDPDVNIFIWVYYPSGKDDAQLATWDHVLHLLEYEIKVDPEIALLAGER